MIFERLRRDFRPQLAIPDALGDDVIRDLDDDYAQDDFDFHNLIIQGMNQNQQLVPFVSPSFPVDEGPNALLSCRCQSKSVLTTTSSSSSSSSSLSASLPLASARWRLRQRGQQQQQQQLCQGNCRSCAETQTFTTTTPPLTRHLLGESDDDENELKQKTSHKTIQNASGRPLFRQFRRRSSRRNYLHRHQDAAVPHPCYWR